MCNYNRDPAAPIFSIFTQPNTTCSTTWTPSPSLAERMFVRRTPFLSGVPLQCHIMRGQASYGVRCNTWLQQNCLQNKLKRPVTLSILISVLYKLVPPSAWDPFCQLELDQTELLCIKVRRELWVPKTLLWRSTFYTLLATWRWGLWWSRRPPPWPGWWVGFVVGQLPQRQDLIRFIMSLGCWSVSSPTSKGRQIRSQPSHYHNLYETWLSSLFAAADLDYHLCWRNSFPAKTWHCCLLIIESSFLDSCWSHRPFCCRVVFLLKYNMTVY